MIKKILIANRAEIALRIIRTCREMGIQTVAIYTLSDQNERHIIEADFCYRLKSEKGYMDADKIIEIANDSGSDAIHPGYGFLSENYEFAQACISNNIIFIGPSPEIIKLMGDKINSLDFVKQNGFPIIENIILRESDIAKNIEEDLQYPCLIKASSGGGGRAMKIVYKPEDLNNSIELVKTQSMELYGNADIFIEQFIENARHIEVQILGDKYSNIIHLFERDCSVQRRHQKLIEESPASNISPELRANILNTAVEIAKLLKYDNAGTIEFLLDKDNKFYFIEMNTRIQVEHPITEEITGIDIVRKQIEIAEAWTLNLTQNNIKLNSHCLELRIYAENPNQDFMPDIKQIKYLHLPEGIRIDSNIYLDYSVNPNYDSLLAKLIIRAENRTNAIDKANRVLDELCIYGPETNIAFLKQILNSDSFSKGDYNTNIIKDIEKVYETSISDDIKNIAVISKYLYEHKSYLNYASKWKSNSGL
ncbi:MAG: ATP-grasp domain-containing protein [Marinifilaceae bacterium]|jgi:acetyl/propionyl-CoA carboxylase alpha subunit|nr:ATP-grasp domain-containing protein [Marinifilaceae bacterium]